MKKSLQALFVVTLIAIFSSGCSWFGKSTSGFTPSTALSRTSCPDNEVLFAALRRNPEFSKALTKSIEYYSKQSSSRLFHFGEDEVAVGTLIQGYGALLHWLKQAQDSPPPPLTSHCYKPNTDSVLLTGYYEGSLKGSLKKTARYNVPVYGIPSDLVIASLSDFTTQPIPANFPKKLTGRVSDQKLVPYYNRDEITFDEKLKRHQPLLYVDDLLKLFFAHIQGSTVVELPSGTMVYLGYGGQNGFAYKSIGKYMIERGYLTREHSSGEDILKFLRTHPSKVREILSQNPSFIFFKKVTPGPFGNIGVALTPRHSVATDSGLMPPGTLAFISTTLPPLSTEGATEELTLHPVMNQDTGGAIKGPGRMDLFLGRGAPNEFQAAHLKNVAEVLFVYFKVE